MRLPRSSMVVFIFACCVCSLADASGRFSATATLSTPSTQQSADQRFSIAAELDPERARQSSDARFSLSAQLAASDLAKAVNTACAVPGVDLFKNGFEN